MNPSIRTLATIFNITMFGIFRMMAVSLTLNLFIFSNFLIFLNR